MKKYPYKMAIRNALSALNIGLGFGGFCIYAVLNGWGIAIRGFEVPPETSAYFYYFFIATSVLILIFSLKLMALGTRTIEVSPSAIVVPKSEASKTMISIAPDDIDDLQMDNYGEIHSLVIRHRGKTTKIRSPHFGSLDTFFEFSDLVADSIGE